MWRSSMKAKRGFSREKAYKSRVEFMQHWGPVGCQEVLVLDPTKNYCRYGGLCVIAERIGNGYRSTARNTRD